MHHASRRSEARLILFPAPRGQFYVRGCAASRNARQTILTPRGPYWRSNMTTKCDITIAGDQYVIYLSTEIQPSD